MGRRERPIEPTSGPLQTFAFDLRLLRAKAGGPSYRKLALKAGFSASALSAAASGVALPSRQVTLAYVSACGGDTAEWAARWESVHDDVAGIWALPEGASKGPHAALVTAVWRYWIEDVLRASTGSSGLAIDVTVLGWEATRTPRLLLVGDPGTGKTITLLTLARHLVVSGAHPVPVIVPLSFWIYDRRPLRTWLAAEISRRYGVSLPLVASWLDDGQLLPLLDGLDAVPASDRIACVEAINQYARSPNALDPLVITCRTGVYTELAVMLHEHSVVRVGSPAVLDSPAVLTEFVRARLELLKAHPARESEQWLRWLAATMRRAGVDAFDPNGLRVDMLARRRHRWLVRQGMGVVLGFAVAIVTGAGPVLGQGFATVAALVTGVLVTLAFVASGAVRRGFVRVLLVKEGAIPRDHRTFLRHAYQVGLLDETRHGYRFVHPQLQQHFARSSGDAREH